MDDVDMVEIPVISITKIKIKILRRWFLIPETNPNQKKIDFPYEAFNNNGKLLLEHVDTGQKIELDFDIAPQDLVEDAEKWMQEASEKMEQKGTKGKFTKLCGGEVTQECIDKYKKSDDPTLVREAVFAENAREASKSKDFEDQNNENLPKTKQNNIKNKTKRVDTMPEEEQTKDLTTDSKKIIDGQEVDTPAEGDDYEAGDKIKGDPYNETEKFVKKEKKMDMEDTLAKLLEKVQAMEKSLTPLQSDMQDYRKDKENKEIREKAILVKRLQEAPYDLSMDMIQDLTLEQLKEKKEWFDKLPIIKDFIVENKHLTHQDVRKYAFDFETPNPDEFEGKSKIFEKAQRHFITHDLGEEKYKQDFGGVY